MRRFSWWRALGATIAFTAVASFVASCSDSTPPAKAVAIVLVGDGTIIGTVGAALTTSPSFSVQDDKGNNLSGRTVTVAVSSGGGTLVGTPAKTTSGSTTVGTWTLGPTAGTQSLLVTAEGLTLIINATANPAAPNVASASGTTSGSGSPNAVASFSPTIIVADQFGNRVANVPVTVTVASQSGSVTNPNPFTSVTGVATVGTWTLGSLIGTQSLTMAVAGLPPVTFSVNVALPAAGISVAAGAFQTAAPGAALAVNPNFRVLNVNGTPSAGQTVTFSVTFGGGSLVATSAVTDAQGNASPGRWTLGARAGAQTITASAGSVSTTVYATALAPAGTGFSLQVRYVGTPPSAAIQTAIATAASRVSQEITAHLSNVAVNFDVAGCSWVQPIPPTPINETVTDDILYVSIAAIDGINGILASTGPCQIRGSNQLPAISIMTIDLADANAMLTNGTLTAVATHEMHHALGYGTLWNDTRFFPVALISGGGTANPMYLGAAANAAYFANGGVSATGIRVENTGGPGTADGHWRESVFRTELMTGYLDSGVLNPLSAMSIMSLADLGFAVSTATADPYTLPAGALRASESAVPPMAFRETLVSPSFIVDDAGHLSRIERLVPNRGQPIPPPPVRKKQ